MPRFGTAETHRISDDSGVINTRQTFGSGDTARGILSWAATNSFDPAAGTPSSSGPPRPPPSGESASSLAAVNADGDADHAGMVTPEEGGG